MIDALEQVLADDVLEGIATREMDELRSVRTRCTEVEADVSLARRVVQGRLDIVGHEVQRRNGVSDADDALPALLFDLPSLMTDDAQGEQASSGPRLGARQVSITAPGQVAVTLVERLDAVASPNRLAAVGELSDDELEALLDRMRSYEVELSGVRRRLHDRIDALQAEIGRRYRDGEASVDSLLA